jgi:hypothetical protein
MNELDFDATETRAALISHWLEPELREPILPLDMNM